MRRTWWSVSFEKDGDGWIDVYVHGGRRYRAVQRASAVLGKGWRLAEGVRTIRTPTSIVDWECARRLAAHEGRVAVVASMSRDVSRRAAQFLRSQHFDAWARGFERKKDQDA